MPINIYNCLTLITKCNRKRLWYRLSIVIKKLNSKQANRAKAIFKIRL